MKRSLLIILEKKIFKRAHANIRARPDVTFWVWDTVIPITTIKGPYPNVFKIGIVWQ